MRHPVRDFSFILLYKINESNIYKFWSKVQFFTSYLIHFTNVLYRRESLKNQRRPATKATLMRFYYCFIGCLFYGLNPPFLPARTSKSIAASTASDDLHSALSFCCCSITTTGALFQVGPRNGRKDGGPPIIS